MFLFIECLEPVNLQGLPEPVMCHLSSSCDGIQCCVGTEALGRTFFVAASIDVCKYQLMVTIEKLSYEISFSEITFGKLYVVKIKYPGMLQSQKTALPSTG